MEKYIQYEKIPTLPVKVKQLQTQSLIMGRVQQPGGDTSYKNRME